MVRSVLGLAPFAQRMKFLVGFIGVATMLLACHGPSGAPLVDSRLKGDVSRHSTTPKMDGQFEKDGTPILPLKVISSIEGASQVLESDATLGFPTSKLYSFKICLDSKLLPHAFEGATLSLKGTEANDTIRITSSQCATWKEIFRYVYTAPSRHIVISRTLIIKNKKLSQSIPFDVGINPWMHGETEKSAEVVDFINSLPRRAVILNESPTALFGEENSEGNAHIIANDARVNFQFLGMNPQQKGGRFTFDFRITPQYEVQSASGASIIAKLANGQFEFESYLIATSLKGDKITRQILNKKSFAGAVKVSDGTLSFIQDIHLDQIPTFGRLELAVSLKPIQSAKYLKPFKGVYILGDYYELKSNFYARLKPGFSNANPDFNYESYINGSEALSTIAAEQNKSNGLRPLKFEFEPLKFDITGITNETSTRRTVTYQVRACIRNGIDATPIRSFNFTISKQSPEVTGSNKKESAPMNGSGKIVLKSQRSSEFDSCIYWEDELEHALYPQKYFKRIYTIENEGLNLKEELVAFINPWNIPSSRDSRTVETPEMNKLLAAEDRKAAIILPYYRSRQLEVNYNIDKYLNLAVEKKTQLFLDAQILNFSNLNRGMEARDPLREGPWKLRWAIIAKSDGGLKSEIVIDQGHLLVPVVQGRIMAKLNFHFKDLRLLDSRNILYLEVAPIDAKQVKRNHQGTFDPLTPTNDLDRLVDDSSGLEARTFFGPLIVSAVEDNQGPLEPYHGDSGSLWKGFAEKASPSSNQKLDSLYHEVFKAYLKANFIRTWDLSNASERSEARTYLSPSKESLSAAPDFYSHKPFNLDLVDRALEKKRLTRELAERLCYYFFDKNPVQTFKFKPNLLSLKKSDHWLRDCVKKSKTQSLSYFVAQMETPLDALETSQFKGSSNSSILVGAGYNVSVSDSLTYSSALSGALQGGVSAKLGAAKELISVGATAAYTLTRTDSSATSRANSSAVTAGISLNVRNLNFELEGLRQTLCLTASLNPLLSQDPDSEFNKDLTKTFASLQKRRSFLDQKIRLCRRFDKPQKFQAPASFYVITQDMNPSSYIDLSDIKNRPMLLQLRGRDSFDSFMRLIGGSMKPSETGTAINPALLTYDGAMAKSIPMVLPTIPSLLSEPLMGE